MPKINENIVFEYEKLLDDLPRIIDAYKLEKSFIASQSGLSRSTFFRKLRNRKFTCSEMKRIVEVINS